jgi:thiol-disulfide isomerase/thioredoxin
MGIMRRRNLFLAVAFFSVTYINPVNGQGPRQIKIGDTAPPLTIQQWIKGEPVNTFQPGQPYVVEFSGTWCSPCRKAIPHLSALSEKYSLAIKILSVYNESNDKEKPEDLNYVKGVETLVKTMGDKMNFSVAVDVPQQTTRENWGLTAWPKCFLIDASGKIAWIGDPMDLDTILAQVKAGTYNADIALQMEARYRKCMDEVRKLKWIDSNYQKALVMVDSLIKVHPEKRTALYYTKFRVLAGADDKKAYELVQWLLDSRIENFDWPHMAAVEFEAISPSNRNYRLELKAIDRTIEEAEIKSLAAHFWGVKSFTYAKMKDYKKAVEASEKAIEVYDEDPSATKNGRQLFRNQLVLHQYELKATRDVSAANKWLKNEILSGETSDDYLYWYMAAVLATSKPDYDFVLAIIDKAIPASEDLGSKIQFLDKKVEIYDMKKDYEKAIAFCQVAMDLSRKEGYAPWIAKHQKKLAELKEKLQP